MKISFQFHVAVDLFDWWLLQAAFSFFKFVRYSTFWNWFYRFNLFQWLHKFQLHLEFVFRRSNLRLWFRCISDRTLSFRNQTLDRVFRRVRRWKWTAASILVENELHGWRYWSLLAFDILFGLDNLDYALFKVLFTHSISFTWVVCLCPRIPFSDCFQLHISWRSRFYQSCRSCKLDFRWFIISDLQVLGTVALPSCHWVLRFRCNLVYDGKHFFYFLRILMINHSVITFRISIIFLYFRWIVEVFKQQVQFFLIILRLMFISRSWFWTSFYFFIFFTLSLCTCLLDSLCICFSGTMLKLKLESMWLHLAWWPWFSISTNRTLSLPLFRRISGAIYVTFLGKWTFQYIFNNSWFCGLAISWTQVQCCIGDLMVLCWLYDFYVWTAASMILKPKVKLIIRIKIEWVQICRSTTWINWWTQSKHAFFAFAGVDIVHDVVEVFVDGHLILWFHTLIIKSWSMLWSRLFTLIG